eukprot:superscaffoldBa00001659_g11505
MYPNSQSARHPAQTLSLNGQYIQPTYDFTYHHVDPSTSAWNTAYAPREEYPFSFPGSSPSIGQVSFTSPELSGTPTAAGGGSFTPYNFISGQDQLGSRTRPHESIRPSVSGEDLVSEQTCQREEDNQEEAAAFPAGLHYHAHPTCTWRTH